VTVLGPMFSAAAIEDAAEATLKLWFTTYLAEMERLTDREPRSLPTPRAWVKSPREQAYVEDQIPAIIIVAGGTNQTPERAGTGLYLAWFELAIGIVVSADNRENTLKLSKDYAAVVRTLILQNPSLGDVAQETRWVEDQYDDGGSDGRREYAAAIVSFLVGIPDVADDSAGLSTPPSDPYGTLDEVATVASAHVDVDKITD
jgi:hypothetical protein